MTSPTTPNPPSSEAPAAQQLHVEYCGEWATISPPEMLTIGREADLSVDDNPYLHRSFLELKWDRYWWLSNVGNRLAATISDDEGAMSAWLAPGATMPLICRTTEVRFTAGPTSYLLSLLVDDPAVSMTPGSGAAGGNTTRHPATLTLNQMLTILALAEPSLSNPRGTSVLVPSSQEAATRLGWAITKFNRQLDAVCQKLARTGVQGLHGDSSQLASGRRSRLVEYALAVRLVTADDLHLLDHAQIDGDPER